MKNNQVKIKDKWSKLNKLSNKWWQVILLISLVLIGGVFWQRFSWSDNSYRLTKGQRVEIIPGEILRQKFLAQDNGLAVVEILIGGKDLQPEYFLDFLLMEADCRRVLRQTTIAGHYVLDSKRLFRFAFLPIADSEQKWYCLKVVYYSKARSAKKKKVRFYLNAAKNDFLPPAEVIRKDKTVQLAAPLVLRPRYRPLSWREGLVVFNQRFSQYKPSFLKGGWLWWWLIIAFFFNTWLVRRLLH